MKKGAGLLELFFSLFTSGLKGLTGLSCVVGGLETTFAGVVVSKFLFDIVVCEIIDGCSRQTDFAGRGGIHCLIFVRETLDFFWQFVRCRDS